MNIWPQPPQRFHWVLSGDVWQLQPSSITVRPDGDLWSIYVHNMRMRSHYASLQGAKLDAWEFAYSKRRALFGAYRITLEDTNGIPRQT